MDPFSTPFESFGWASVVGPFNLIFLLTYYLDISLGYHGLTLPTIVLRVVGANEF